MNRFSPVMTLRRTLSALLALLAGGAARTYAPASMCVEVPRTMGTSGATMSGLASSSLLVVALAAASATTALAAPSDTLWRYTAAARITGTELDAAGNLVIAMDDLVVALHPDSGTPVWTHRLGGRPSVARTVLDSLFIIGHGTTVTAIDPVTGTTVWQRTDIPDLEHTSFVASRRDPYALAQTKQGFAVLDMRTGATRWDSGDLPSGTIVREYFRLSDQNLLLVLARTPASDVTMLAATLDSGRVLWRNDAFFRAKPHFKRERDVEYLSGGFQYSVLFPDTTLFLYFSPDGPMRLDPRTGSIRWQSAELAGASVPGWMDGYPTACLRDSLVLVPSGRRLVALDAATGRVRWRTARDFRDQPTALLAESTGVLVGGLGREKSFVTGLDLRTGDPVWPKPLGLKASAIGMLKSDTLFVSDEGRFSAIPLRSGSPRHVATIDFQGGEQPARIDTLRSGGGFILWSRQNIVRIDNQGRIAYHRFYKAPGASFWTKFATSALLVAANVASYALTPPGGLAPVIVSNPVLSARYGQISEAENFFYVFTESPDSQDQKGFSLVKVDRRDGRELGRMWFEGRSPDYRVDRATGSVYELESDTRVIARRFQP